MHSKQEQRDEAFGHKTTVSISFLIFFFFFWTGVHITFAERVSIHTMATSSSAMSKNERSVAKSKEEREEKKRAGERKIIPGVRKEVQETVGGNMCILIRLPAYNFSFPIFFVFPHFLFHQKSNIKI